jgi:hypothetical protein
MRFSCLHVHIYATRGRRADGTFLRRDALFEVWDENGDGELSAKECASKYPSTNRLQCGCG